MHSIHQPNNVFHLQIVFGLVCHKAIVNVCRCEFLSYKADKKAFHPWFSRYKMLTLYTAFWSLYNRSNSVVRIFHQRRETYSAIIMYSWKKKKRKKRKKQNTQTQQENPCMGWWLAIKKNYRAKKNWRKKIAVSGLQTVTAWMATWQQFCTTVEFLGPDGMPIEDIQVCLL